MAYTKTIDDCDDYFKPNNHLNSFDYRSYDADIQAAAFAQAKRELEVSLGTELTDPLSGATYRCDYAHFEQVLFILLNTTRQEVGGVTNVISDEETDTDKNPIRQGVLISPQAQRYLGLNRIKMSRG